MTAKTLRLEADALALRALLEDLETTIGAMSENDLAMEQVGEAFNLAEKLAAALADTAGQVERAA